MGAVRQDAVLSDGAPESLGMLQRRSARRAPADIPPELERVLPISWVHVPKCGSSFVNTLIHLPGACSPAIPEDLYVSTETYGFHFLAVLALFWQTNRNCPGLDPDRLGHKGLGNESSTYYSEREGRFMIMLRSPEPRLNSAYLDMVLSSTSEPFALTSDESSWGGWPTKEVPSLSEYASYARGCAVRMLTRSGQPCGGAGGPPLRDEIDLAKERLRTGFAFVGITEQWALSMCLFNAMFKTSCQAFQFSDARPGLDKSKEEPGYGEKQLERARDPYDEELYEEAVRIFEAHLERYNVSEASCQPCWRAAGVSPTSVENQAASGDQV